MSSTLTEEQDALRRVIRRFLEERSPEASVRATMAGAEGIDRDLWRTMAAELELLGLAIPTRYGGSGATWREVCVVMGELGRSLACLPFLSTVCLGANAILRSGDDAAMEALLPRIASGEAVVAVAFLEGPAPFDPGNLSTVARVDGDRFVLNGAKRYVIDGCAADSLLVLATGGRGPSLYLVEPGAALARSPLSTLDQTRRQASCTFEDTAARLVGEDGAGWRILEGAIDLAIVGLAAEAVGGAERCLDMAVEYAKVREQFGRPIGSFQAIKHKCANVYVGVELARAAAEHAAAVASDGAADLAVAASTAKSYCCDAFLHAAKENIQIHGGIGYTWDHPAHLYLKRAKTDQILLGDSAFHRGRVARELGL